MKTFFIGLFVSIIFLTSLKVKSQTDTTLWYPEGLDTIATLKNVKVKKNIIVSDTIKAESIKASKLLKVGDKGAINLLPDQYVYDLGAHVDVIQTTNDETHTIVIMGNSSDLTVNPIKVGIGTFTPLNFNSNIFNNNSTGFYENHGLEVNGQINLTDATWCPVNSPDATNNKINAYRIRGVSVLSVQTQLTPRNIFSFNFIYSFLII